MHEMSLCEGMREVLEDQARLHELSRITRVRVEIGRFSCVEKTALAFAFDEVMRGSVAEGATLEMIDLPGRATCLDCNAEVVLEDRLSSCPRCGGGRLMPVAGDEMRIKNLEAA